MTPSPLQLDPRRTALVTIDLQRGILPYAQAPRPASVVLEHAARLTEAFRARQALIVRVKVGFSADGADRLTPPVDAPTPASPTPSDWLDDPAELPTLPGDLCILKRQWGAFQGTELDLQLRRRGIRTLVVGGIATPFGVESTVRFAFELGYEILVVEDLCAAPRAELHAYPFQSVFPRLARVRTTAELLAAWA